MKNRIHIFGASGSGTTTLGKKLCEELGYFFMDTDDYFWLPTDPKFTVKRSAQERIELMTADINVHPNVVISGALAGWGDVLIPCFTLAIRLHTDPAVRIARLREREFQRFGSRIQEGGDMYAQHQQFIEWAKQYDTGDLRMRSRAQHDRWQEKLCCELLHLDGADAPEKNAAIIAAHLKENSTGHK